RRGGRVPPQEGTAAGVGVRTWVMRGRCSERAPAFVLSGGRRPGGPAAQLPQVGILEEAGVRGEDRGQEAEAPVEPAAVCDVIAQEAPGGAGAELPQPRAAAAGVQVLSTPLGVRQHLVELVAQVAI